MEPDTALPNLDAVHIRPARPEEKQAVVDLTLAAYAEYASEMPAPVFAEYMDRIVHTLTQDAQGEMLVLVDNGAVVASTLLYPAGIQVYGHLPGASAYPEVRLLAVDPRARGRGYARALMRECERMAREQGATGLGLHTSDVMRGAQKLYADLGYERFPQADFYPSPELCVKGYLLRFDLQ